MKKIIAPLLGIIALLSITANVLLVKRWSDARPIVTIGNHVITRGEYQSALDVATDGSVLKNLVYRTVVMEAARKNGLLPTDAQIAAKVTEVQQKQPQLLDVPSQGMAKVAQNRVDIVAAVALENLRMASVEVTDDDIKSYYAQHVQDFTVPKQVQTTLVITQDPVNTATAERLLRSGSTPDSIAMHPGLLVVGVNSTGIDMNQVPSDLRQQIQNAVYTLKAGDVRSFHDNRTALTYRIDSSRDAYLPPIAEIRDAVARQAKLQKALPAQAELAVIYKQIGPKFNVQKYAPYFEDMARSGNVTTASLP